MTEQRTDSPGTDSPGTESPGTDSRGAAATATPAAAPPRTPTADRASIPAAIPAAERAWRVELAGFLRARRERVRPGDVGLPEIGPRRTPGLRRQEVAQLAGMSVDYYIRLEQGRGPHPSRQVLAALGRALMLTNDEREYLFRIAGENPPQVLGPVREVSPSIRMLLDRMVDLPAYVVDAAYDILAWNDLARHFVGDLSKFAETERNMIRWMFTRHDDDLHWNDEQAVRLTRASVADLRAAYARYPGNPRIASLVAELRTISERFVQMWAAHEVAERRITRKRVEHPLAGPLEFVCQVLHVPDSDQRLIVYVPDSGSPTARAFERLRELELEADPG